MSKVIRDVTKYFTPEDVVDIRIVKEENKFVGAHGYLHMQKFWQSPKPIKLPEFEHMNMKNVFDNFWKDLEENWETYRRNMERKIWTR
ncbi:MAG: hypothetical protein ABH874_06485 [Methanobacteriota archaeon]